MSDSTVIGNVGAAVDALVDGRGLLSIPHDGPPAWSLDWLAGVADRWLLPADAAGAAVTQRRAGGLPVVETSLRVPGGQLVHRAWCVAVGGGDAAVVEVENRSRDAVALALVVDAAAGASVGFDGERTATVGGRRRVVFGRPPARVATGSAEAARAVVTAGDAPVPAGEVGDRGSIAFVFPLAHTARLRVAVPMSDGMVLPPLDTLADADAVARGWQGHLDGAARVVVPDPRLADAVAAARTCLLIAQDRPRSVGDAAAVGLALALWGHGDASAAALDGVVDQQRLDGGFSDRKDLSTTAAVLVALAAHSLTARGAELVASGAVSEPVAKAAHRVARRHRRGERPPWFSVAQVAAAEVLERAGQADAAALCRDRIATTHPSAVLDEVDLDVPGLAGVAGPDALVTAGFLTGFRRFLVDDTEPPVLRLLPRFPDDWLGQEVEGHRLPTRAGLLAFALRWHGARPALLWELDGSGPSHLTIGLDPAWSSDRPSGEALLAAVEPAGGLPKVVGPLASEGTPVDEAPGDGVSFS